MARLVASYAVVILPPPQLHRELIALRKRHPLLRSVSPPHITVKAPVIFRTTGAQVVDRLTEICAAIDPFEITLQGLSHFDNSVIFLRVVRSPELVCLHEAILAGLEDLTENLNDRYEGAAFTPHLTLAENLLPDDCRVVRDALAGYRPVRRSFTVERVHLLRGRGRWDITRSIPLGPHW